MVKHTTVARGRGFNPVRSKKRRSRRRKSRYSERTKTDQTFERCVTITLRDVGDIDDKELNTIPSSVQGETSSWGDKNEDRSNDNSFASYTNPLLQVGSADFCQLCTKKLLDIHETDGGVGDVCDHEGNGDDQRRKNVAQSIMKVFQSITEGRFDESTVNIVQSKMHAEQEQQNIQARLMKKKCRTLSKAINTSNREMAKCSLSRLSIQVMCTSESTVSTAITQDPTPVVLWPPQEKLKPESIVTKKKLETVAGALLMELCKVTAEKIDQNTSPESQKKLLLAKDSYMPRLRNARHGRPTTGYSALDARLPDWLRELCQEDDPKIPKRGILKKAKSQLEKSKINIFRPLLCTKLSIPWLLPKSLPQITCKKQHELDMLKRKSSSVVKHKIHHHKSKKDRANETKKEDSNESARRESKCSEPGGTKVVHAYDTRNVRYRSSDSVVPSEGKLAPIEVPLRLFASKTIREVKSAKKKRTVRREDRDSTEDRVSHRFSNSHQDCREVGRVKEKRLKEVCPKCQSSIQCSIALRRNSPKLRKIKTKTHNVLAYPCKKIVKKTKPSSRQEKNVRQQLELSRENGKTRHYNHPTTKYFIKSFFTGTSTSETTKPAVKTIKKVGRRKKTAPPRIAGRPVTHDAKKIRVSPTSRSPRRHHAKIEKEDSNSDIELEIQASEEMDIINQHIRAHKTASDSSPVFHTCFKRLLDKELKAQSGRDSKPSRSRKISKGGYFFGRPPSDVKRFNEGIFSCLIPKVFK